MNEGGSVVELVRCRFRNGDPARPLRHRTRSALPDEIDPASVDDVLVVVSELVQNVSQHTAGGGELVVSLSPGVIVVEVGDTSTTAPSTRDSDRDGSGGRGLLLVEALSRRWGVRTCPRGKAVWVQLTA